MKSKNEKKKIVYITARLIVANHFPRSTHNQFQVWPLMLTAFATVIQRITYKPRQHTKIHKSQHAPYNTHTYPQTTPYYDQGHESSKSLWFPLLVRFLRTSYQRLHISNCFVPLPRCTHGPTRTDALNVTDILRASTAMLPGACILDTLMLIKSRRHRAVEIWVRDKERLFSLY